MEEGSGVRVGSLGSEGFCSLGSKLESVDFAVLKLGGRLLAGRLQRCNRGFRSVQVFGFLGRVGSGEFELEGRR